MCLCFTYLHIGLELHEPVLLLWILTHLHFIQLPEETLHNTVSHQCLLTLFPYFYYWIYPSIHILYSKNEYWLWKWSILCSQMIIFFKILMLWQGFFGFFSSGFCKLYYILTTRLLVGVWLNTIDMLSLIIWIYLFCHIVFACKKKVFTTFLHVWKNIDNIKENNYILHLSLIEIEAL